jgi:hypothetical protein
MNGNECKKLLSQAIITTLESLAFIQLIESGATRRAGDAAGAGAGEDYLQDMLSVYIPVKSRYGVIIMSASKAILMETARNIFALDPEAAVGEDMLNDTISELLNTISGQFMRAMTPKDEFYELGLPVIGSFNMDEIGKEAVDCAFETENGDKLFISYIFL